MDRRKFLKNSLKTWGAMALPARAQAVDAPTTAGKLNIQYIRKDIPHFEIPPYCGRSYQDKVPDTIDLTEQVKLGIHGLTGIADPQADYEIHWLADFFRNPPVMVHDFSDWVQIQEGLVEALPLLRLATGGSLNSQVDPAWMASLLKSVGPDGLVYVPLNGRPWGRIKASGVKPVWKTDGSKTTFDDPSVSQFTNAASCGRAIGAMLVYHLRDQNPMWTTAIENIIQRLTQLTLGRGAWCYFSGGVFEPHARIDPGADMPRGSLWGTTCNARLIQALGQYYRVAGYEPARELGIKLAGYTRYHGEIFDPQGRWLLDPEVKKKVEESRGVGNHTQSYRKGGNLGEQLRPGAVMGYNVEGLTLGGQAHGHSIALLSVLDFALAVGDKELIAFVKAGFEWLRNPGPAYGVSNLVGWFPEWYVPDFPACESCTLGDFAGMAVKMSEAGVGDYWDDIDRCVRNQYTEAQLTQVDWVYRMAENQPRKPVAFNETADHAPEMNIGAWTGWGGASEWATWVGIQHCCTGNASRGLYYIWEHMVDFRDGDLKVNLLMNRASRWADVYSYIPNQGRVDLKMKEACRKVSVRAPEWVETGSPGIVCKVNGAPRPLHWEGRYVNVGAASQGDRVVATFPISERTVKEKIGPETYTLVIRGNTVVSIDPVGRIGPLYQDREKYRTSEVAWRNVKRFVSDETIDW
jgi:hypothetical protein